MRRALIATLGIALVVATAAGAAAAAPVAYDDEVTAIESEESVFNVLENDLDEDGDALTLESHTQSVEGGSLSCETDGTCTYTDPGGPTPYEDSFTYVVTDGTSTDEATVTITVAATAGGGGGGGPDSFAKTVTLSLARELIASGSISSSAPKCTQDEPVRIFRREDGYFNLVKKTTTNSEGRYRIRIPHRFGVYRVETPVRGQCDGDLSPKRSYLTNSPQTIADGDDVPGFLDIAKVRIDHDGFNLYFKWTAQDSWKLSSLSGGRRLGVYLFYSGGYYSIDIDMGEDQPIVPIVPCSGSPGSGNSCDYDAIQYGNGKKAGPKAITFTLPLGHLDEWPNPGSWRGHSASNPGSGFDFTNKKSYGR